MTIDASPGAARALWYTAPGQTELRVHTLRDPASDEVRVAALFSAISRGTESLVFHGRVPASEFERMRAPLMEGHFPFAVKYGYAAVGRVTAGSAALQGKTVFALHPHQSAFNIAESAVALVPDDVPPQRAILAANMETALNGVWDAAPGPADRIAVVGAGVVGSLIAYLCGRLPGADVTLIDVNPARAELAARLGVKFESPMTARGDCDLVIHASGAPRGLQSALELAGEEATVLEMSWYGDAAVSLPLGGAFHSRRLRLISSQVGRVAPSHRARWSYARRLAAALALLRDDRLDALLMPAIAFDDLPQRLPALFAPGSEALCQPVSYL